MVLIEELEKNIEWYRRNGKKFKQYSFTVRGLYLALFTAALISMAFLGAGLATVIFGVLGGAAALLDRVFNITRNWVEFSYLEVSLSCSVAAIRYHESRGEDDAALQQFKEAVNKIETETLGWQADVTQGVRELKGLFETNFKQSPT